MRIRSAGTELLHADRRTDAQTDMMKLIVAFGNFANASKNGPELHCTINIRRVASQIRVTHGRLVIMEVRVRT
jgi:hypothetical protein